MVYADREKRIEDLLCRFPSLFGIAPDHQILRQYSYLDGGQADVVFRWSSESLVVEVKNDPLYVKDLRQLKKYLLSESMERPAADVRGLLLGHVSTTSETLKKRAEEWKLRVEIWYAEKNFMLQVKYCRKCSQPFWASISRCPRCLSTDYVTIDFAAD